MKTKLYFILILFCSIKLYSQEKKLDTIIFQFDKKNFSKKISGKNTLFKPVFDSENPGVGFYLKLKNAKPIFNKYSTIDLKKYLRSKEFQTNNHFDNRKFFQLKDVKYFLIEDDKLVEVEPVIIVY